VIDLPKAGDLVWVNFNPQAGHEQVGRRPALVLSPVSYHEKTALAVVRPIDSNVPPYPFKVLLPEGLPIGGAALADQVTSIDPAGATTEDRRCGATVGGGRDPGKIAALLGIDAA
jgi:mRNA interferase MazF